MAYERDYRPRRSRRVQEPEQGREPVGPDEPYRPSTFHGYGMGYRGGALRSRGSYGAGQLRSGLNPRDEFEFEWGGGYVGGRGYGGTNYDLQHGYRTTAAPRAGRAGAREPEPGGWGRERTMAEEPPEPMARPLYDWRTAAEAGYTEGYGPARYGYGPYYERLQRRRRSDEEIRAEVEEALFYDTWVDSDRIKVEVNDGIVTLSGTLTNYEEVRFATDDAWEVDGVRGVLTRLEVDETGRAAFPRDEREAASTRGERPGEARGVRATSKTAARSASKQGGETGAAGATKTSRSTGRSRSGGQSRSGSQSRGGKSGRSGE